MYKKTINKIQKLNIFISILKIIVKEYIEYVKKDVTEEKYKKELKIAIAEELLNKINEIYGG